MSKMFSAVKNNQNIKYIHFIHLFIWFLKRNPSVQTAAVKVVAVYNPFHHLLENMHVCIYAATDLHTYVFLMFMHKQRKAIVCLSLLFRVHFRPREPWFCAETDRNIICFYYIYVSITFFVFFSQNGNFTRKDILLSDPPAATVGQSSFVDFGEFNLSFAAIFDKFVSICLLKDPFKLSTGTNWGDLDCKWTKKRNQKHRKSVCERTKDA